MGTGLAALDRVLVGSCVALLVACGGGGYGGGGNGSTPRATLSISVSPTTITVGQSATVTWSSNGANCRASGAWSGTRPGSGSESVTPDQAGMFTYTLTCSGGGYGESQELSATLTVNPTSAFKQTLLVSRYAGTAAPRADSKLTNPRGIAFAPRAPARVINSTTSTAYDGKGNAQPQARALSIVSASTSDVAFDPTGIVVNTTADFRITADGKSGSAEFIYAGKGGMIGAWDGASTATMYIDADGAVYTGLAVARDGRDHFLYATDFRNGRIDVFDASFKRQPPTAGRFAFRDPALLSGYAPFGIQAIENGAAGAAQIYVTYARQIPPDGRDGAIGSGLGLVNVFDANGALLKRLVPAGGALNAPWGIALAPADFGTFSDALLIGNQGDGRINAYDAASGRFIGTMSDPDGRPIVTSGLWGIAFGNDSNDQPRNTLFFTAGTDEADGTYGRIDLLR